MWAARKIGYDLQEIRLHGAKPALIEEVVKLSREFGIVTEYTAFLAEAAAAEMSEATMREEAQKRMSSANAVQSGKWATTQARNDKALQKRKVASPAANVYIDRKGAKKRSKTVRQIGGRAYYLRDGRWVDAQSKGKRKSRVIKRFSKEYFDLVEQNADFARSQTLDADVTINVEDERIEVR